MPDTGNPYSDTMQISERLRAVSEMVTEGNRIADIGTDHGYVPIWLLKQGRIPKAIGMDVRPGPLAHAKENRKQYGVEDKMELRLSDGLSSYQCGEADCIVIAGMGGELMLSILKEGREKLLGVQELVLSPQSEIRKVREYLADEGFRLEREVMLKEDGKYYVIMKAVPGENDYREPYEFTYGKRLLEGAEPVMEEYLYREEGIYQALCEHFTEALLRDGKESVRVKERKEEAREQLILIKQAQNCLQSKKSKI